MGKKVDFTLKIIEWYTINKRDLPWRETKNPYFIWLSEIILQQTRIDQGLAYYNRFTDRFPTAEKLAKASEDDVLKLWQGLGYYSRARNLHFTAKTIVSTHNGNFPESYEELLKLKGVGEYTAAAIASIAFNLPHASVDGNVYRVLSRYFGISEPIDSSAGKKLFKALAEENMDINNPGTYNQAMMELGAMVCTPRNAQCKNCPVQKNCIAKASGTIYDLPVKKGKTKIRNRYFNYLIFISDENTYLNKRTKEDIWKNLYEFPVIETANKTKIKDITTDIQSLTQQTSTSIIDKTSWHKHILSHQHIYYRFITIKIDSELIAPAHFIKVNKKDIFNFAVPKLVEREINRLNWF